MYSLQKTLHKGLCSQEKEQVEELLQELFAENFCKITIRMQ